MPFACEHISVWLCMPVSKQTYLLSNVRGWAGWRMMLRRQSQKWSPSLGLLWRPGCFLWSTWEPEFDPAGRSCPWLPDLLCLETLDWWKQTREKQISTLLPKAFWHWFNLDRVQNIVIFCTHDVKCRVHSFVVSRPKISPTCILHCLSELDKINENSSEFILLVFSIYENSVRVVLSAFKQHLKSCW